jgi:hypothetical protein
MRDNADLGCGRRNKCRRNNTVPSQGSCFTRAHRTPRRYWYFRSGTECPAGAKDGPPHPNCCHSVGTWETTALKRCCTTRRSGVLSRVVTGAFGMVLISFFSLDCPGSQAVESWGGRVDGVESSIEQITPARIRGVQVPRTSDR